MEICNNTDDVRNSDGLTEAEFLAAYRPGDFPHPSCTADLALYYRDNNKLELLLIRRGNHPSLGKWALPGGFVNPDETVEAAAARELAEETGVGGDSIKPTLLGVFSEPGRDPRGWTITSLFGAITDEKPTAHAADDARDAHWFNVDYKISTNSIMIKLDTITIECAYTRRTSDFGADYIITERENGGIAFDHAKLIALSVLKLNDKN
ncbi:MAG: NUDIX hydrolase [Clostridiales bacterium]|nr:NUDIX hydrolase [Clostridiales bacterium]